MRTTRTRARRSGQGGNLIPFLLGGALLRSASQAPALALDGSATPARAPAFTLEPDDTGLVRDRSDETVGRGAVDGRRGLDACIVAEPSGSSNGAPSAPGTRLEEGRP